LAAELLAAIPDGRIKLYLTYQALNYRREHPRLFAEGAYLPLEASGTKRDHVCAFARSVGEEAVLVIVPRLVVRLVGGEERPPLGADVWGQTRLLLPPQMVGRTYRNLFTGETIAANVNDDPPGLLLGTVLRRFPVALLEGCGRAALPEQS
jgi:(1->4)-alpha-D-glucan 1-alpha-D-glucosylmutase